MTEQIKYEPVFGDQNLFIPAPPDAIVARYGKDFYNYESKVTLTTGELRSEPIVAMRRIIRTPVWTKEDQKAGKLPEVGAKFFEGGYGEDEVIKITDTAVVALRPDNHGAVSISKPLFFTGGSIKPIESPEEKAARLRKEWCVAASKQLKNLEYNSTLTSIYDALLSGDLPMPGKGE